MSAPRTPWVEVPGIGFRREYGSADRFGEAYPAHGGGWGWTICVRTKQFPHGSGQGPGSRKTRCYDAMGAMAECDARAVELGWVKP